MRVSTEVGGVEAEMAIRGALTTPGTKPPLATLDLGGGSTDASIINESGEIRSVHLAGAGDMVTLLIDTELGLNDFELAEEIKKYPLAKVETLFHMRHEDGSVQFFHEPLDPRLFGRVVVLADNGPIPLETRELLARIVAVRQQAKKKVFVRNALRALERVAPAGNIRLINFVVLVGGSGLDFEIPKMISDALFEWKTFGVRLAAVHHSASCNSMVEFASIRAPREGVWPTTVPCRPPGTAANVSFVTFRPEPANFDSASASV